MAISSKEIFSLLSVLSFTRYFNLKKVWWGYIISSIWKRPFLFSSPYAISIETNTNCNLRCPECPTGNLTLKRANGKIEPEQFKKIIDEVYKKTFYLNLYLQGEPFLHPQINELIKYAVQKKMFVCVSTNGHFLDQEFCDNIIQSGLQKIIISLDGASAETYEEYRRGGNYNIVTTGIETLSNAKKKTNSRFPVIEIQMIVNRYNEHEINAMKSLTKKLGADTLELKTMQLEQHAEFLPERSKLKRYYRNKEGKLQTINKLSNKCRRLWTTTVITWDGEMASCCYDKNAEFGPGNVFTSSVLTLWKSNEMNQFRKRVLKQRKEIEICRNCNE